MEVDWVSQFHKVAMAGYEKGTGDVGVGTALTAGGVFTGKAISGGVGQTAGG